MVSPRARRRAGKRAGVVAAPGTSTALVALSAAMALACWLVPTSPAPPDVAAGGHDPLLAPVPTAELVGTYAALPGGGRMAVRGVYSVRRVAIDPVLGRTVHLEMAVAEPIMRAVAQASELEPLDPLPRIALTFDDGPSARYTPQILDIFAEHGGRCTFFVLGALASGHAELVRRIEEEGHEVGIHSWRHDDYTRLSAGGVRADLQRCRTVLDPLLEQPVRFVRPPYGAINATVRAAIADAGYRVAMWTVDPRDWQAPGSSVVADRVLSRAHDGAVVVLHDGGSNRSGTVAAMRTVVPELIARGYRLVTLSELHGLAEPRPQERGMRLSIGDERFVIEADFEDITVRVDNHEVEVATPPVRTREQFLVHARPVLKALGAGVGWDPESLTVTIASARGEFEVRLNSLDVSRNGRSLHVRVPAVYYHDAALLPVWLIANACGARVVFNEEERAIEFFSAGAAGLRPVPRRQADPPWMRGIDGTDLCDGPPRRGPRITSAGRGADSPADT